jgi:hypothetical protein
MMIAIAMVMINSLLLGSHDLVSIVFQMNLTFNIKKRECDGVGTCSSVLMEITLLLSNVTMTLMCGQRVEMTAAARSVPVKCP